MNLNFKVEENIAGLKVFYFVPTEDVEYETKSNVILKSGKIWYVGKATKFTPDITERIRRTRAGNAIAVNLEGFIAKRTSDLDDVLSYMIGREYVVVYEDLNGRMKIAGSLDHPLTFQIAARTGKAPGNRSGIEFSFSGNSIEMTRNFGGFLVHENSPTAPEVPVALPVTVKWNDDTVIAVLQPGQTLIITSEFEASEFKIV